MNLSNTIIPKSDQLNADDLIAGPRTIKITAVESGSAEQPVLIRYAGDNGRPYKPSKSMRRVLVVAWGTEGSAYIGRSITLYRDPLITFGPDAVGGICISHASDIAEPLSIALTVKRGKRKPFSLQPLVVAPAEDAPDLQALTDVGESKSREGMTALQTWWGTLPTSAKHALKTKLPDWKQTAESADAQNGRAA